MIALSAYAERRARQRGVTQRDLALLLDHADIDVPVGAGCRALRVHHRTARRLNRRLNLGDRLPRIAAVENAQTGEIVTVLRHLPGRRGRPYRRGR